MNKKIIMGMTSIVVALSLIGCTSGAASTDSTTKEVNTKEVSTTESIETTTVVSSTEATATDDTGVFTERDLEQTADLSEAVTLAPKSGEDLTITEAGVYVLSGTYEDVTVIVEAADDAKVQLVLDGYHVNNIDAPAIYIKSGDKIFVTSTDSENSLNVTGAFIADGETNLDAVIFSKSDLVLNGVGTVQITSAQGNAVSSKDDLKITGGTYVVTASEDGFEANDGLYVYDGKFNVTVDKDAFHSENSDDLTVGEILILGGTFNISAGDDAIQGTTKVQIDDGVIIIETSTEGIEATNIEINSGDIKLYASDDGINASQKGDLDVAIVVNGGTIDVTMGSGDTDAFDANGSITINGGTINVTAGSAFDSDAGTTLNGGTVTVNGEVITEITQSQMGPGQMQNGQVKPGKRP